MWRLKTTESGTAAPLSLLAGKEYVVGRKNCDILLSNDQSISRVHAHIMVTEQTVSLKDSSKYGTFVNDKRLESGSTVTVYAGDKITFGVFQSKFKLELDSVVVCSSCVDNEGKATLSRVVQALGGRLVNTWSQECTHLVMPAVKVTIKTICALLCCRPIVKPEFFTELASAVQQRAALPKPSSFIPEIDEPSLSKEKVDLGASHERKTLFAGKTFVFLNTKQMKRLSQAISFGGGKSQLLEEGSVPVSLLESRGTCVVDVTTGSSQPFMLPNNKKWAESVGLVLHRNGLRFIAESEIGLAAIYASNQTYCNPCSSLNSESLKLKPAIPEASLTQNAAVEETVLHGASLNITAYVVNTEPSQIISRMDVSGATAVSETPEKHPANSQAPTATSKKPSMTTEPPAACSEPVSSFSRVKETKAKSKIHNGDESAKLTNSLNITATIKKSPQKQASLTTYFKPSNKKRLREGSSDSEPSGAKLSRQEDEGSGFNLAPSLQKSTSPSIDSKTSRNQQDAIPSYGFSGSLGLGSGLATDSRSSGGNQNMSLNVDSSSKKRKEPERDPGAPADLDLSLEELESIMSVDLDEPMQPAANKKQCLDQEDRSTVITGEICNASFNKQQKGKKPQNVDGTSQSSVRDKRSSANQDLERKSQVTSDKTQDMERERHSLTHGRDRCETKEEEVSFLLETKVQNGFTKNTEEAAVKEELVDLDSGNGPQKGPDHPRKLLQVHFKFLTISGPGRMRTEPLQSHDPNAKNFKRFRKAPVPGLQGLPRIIGGSDLVPHNRNKNTELEEWLRDAAEQEKQQEREESLGDDLFRYNPKTTKRR